MEPARGQSGIYDLRVNDRTAPMGIDVSSPVFSWKMCSAATGARQTAYRVMVTAESGIPMWDSGWVHSDRSVGIRYGGAALEACTRYTVSVTMKDQDGCETGAAITTFETGLPQSRPFGAAYFITIDEKDAPVCNNLPAYRKAFETKPGLSIVKARLYSTALGVYESFINGQRVGRLQEDGSVLYEELKPGYTQMEDRKSYSTYDVTWMLRNGAVNVLSSIVTSGWWNGLAVQFRMPEELIFHENAYLAKLVIAYSDGSTQVINTDSSWKAARAAAVQEGTGLWEGEVYDARVDQGWMKPGFDGSQWCGVKQNTEFQGVICPWRGVPVMVRADLQRRAEKIVVYQGAVGAADDCHGKINVVCTAPDFDGGVTLLPGQTLLVDFGQNFAGRECLHLKAPAGTRLDIKHGEMVNDCNGQKSRGNKGPEGSLYNYNYTKNTPVVGRTIYYASGSGDVETYHPMYAFYGFRYIEITVDKETVFYNICGQVVTSALEDTGTLVTSDESVNRLISNARWGMYSNYLSVPTDCPQRDERQAWTADTQNFAETGCWLNRTKSFLEKYMADIRDAQDEATGSVPGVAPTGYKNGARWGVVGWADAIVLIPWFVYQMYGDTAIIEENWDAMAHFMDTYMAKSGGMGGNWGTLTSPTGEKIGAYGDWLSPEDGSQAVSDRLGTAYYAWDAMVMAKMARAANLGTTLVQKYEALYEAEKKLFQDRYVTESGEMDMNVQSVCLHALYLDLLPNEKSVAAVAKQLISNIESKGNKLGTGFLGTEIIMHTLTKIGRSDVAYKLLLQHEYPSWLYSVDQGATTIWERWNSYTVEGGFHPTEAHNTSFNHYSYGSVVAWMFRGMAGISYDEARPGFKHILLKPQPDRGIPVVKASYHSIYGTIVSHMQYEAHAWNYLASIPANTTATIYIPAKQPDALTVGNTSGLHFAGYDTKNRVAVFEAVAGTYSFECAL
ncbi:MAG: family 78 glycoside hydrolase catalytic domain [Oscillospiraceae bacterium]|nr:family 78 glycoside hydrolase catalytic domain [Oscillospiraceae bacterium]